MRALLVIPLIVILAGWAPYSVDVTRDRLTEGQQRRLDAMLDQIFIHQEALALAAKCRVQPKLRKCRSQK